MAKIIRIAPNPGPQEKFLSSSADIVIYGGQAGGGKTWGLLIDALRNHRVKGFYAVIFRRTTPQVRNPGGMWDEATELYSQVEGAMPRAKPLDWRWRLGPKRSDYSKIKFSHMDLEKDKLDWQGSQICMIGFDELTHFSETQFFYMLSRNRSKCGIRPRVRATCNPDADSWVAKLIDWWIDDDTGFPIPERIGVIRWFHRDGDTIVWADTPEELVERYPKARPKSLTFIPASVYDNAPLMEKDPDYIANLMAMPLVDRARLLDGNWKIKPAAGLYFKSEWIGTIEQPPPGTIWVRRWDLAGTEAKKKTKSKNDDGGPDWTVGALLGKMPDGRFVMADARRLRADPGDVETALKNTSDADEAVGREVRIVIPQDPAQAGKFQARYLVAQLAPRVVEAVIESGDKETRFKPFSAQCKAGNVVALPGKWREETFRALERFPEAGRDDADAWGGAFQAFFGSNSGFAEYARKTAEEAEQRAKETRQRPEPDPENPRSHATWGDI